MEGNDRQSRGHVLIRNTLFNLGSQAWFFVLALAATPYILAHLGAESYGLLSLVGVIVGWFSFLELGLGKAVLKYVAEDYGRGDYVSIRRTIGTSLVTYFFMGFVGALLIGVFAGVAATRVLKIGPGLVETARLVLYISALGFLINMPLSVFGAIPRALQRFDLFNKVSVTVGTLQTLLTVLLLYGGFRLREVVLLNVAMSALGSLLYLAVSRQLLPGVSLVPRFEFQQFRKLLRFGGYEAALQVAYRAAFQANKLLVGVFLPVSFVTYYAIPYALITRLNVVPGALCTAVFPAISELHGLDKREALLEVYFRSTRYTTIAMLALVPPLVVYSRELLGLWISPAFADKASLAAQILLVGAVVDAAGSSSTVAAQGCDRPEIPARFAWAAAVMNVGLCLLLIPRYGVAGAAIAWSSYSLVLGPVAIYFISTRIVRVGMREFFKKSFSRPLSAGLAISVLAVLLKPLATSAVALFAVLASLFTLYAAITFWVVLDAKDKDTMWSFAASSLGSLVLRARAWLGRG